MNKPMTREEALALAFARTKVAQWRAQRAWVLARLALARSFWPMQKEA